MNAVVSKLKIIFEDIKIQHTVFALPFALMSAFLAAEGMPAWNTLLWILVAMFGARSSALAFNRIVDATFDEKNPRTADRALPAGKINRPQYMAFLFVSAAVFVGAASMLNPLALMLSPLALAIIFFYSFTKRFTAYSHVFLGFALSVAPVGAWVAVREEISLISLILGAAVVFWLTGFDILYSCLDVEADRKNRLHSIPQRFGVERALQIAWAAHALMVIFLMILFIDPQLGATYITGVVAVAVLLAYEHSLVKSDDMSRVNMAFFNVNGIISVLLMTLVIVDCVWV